MVDGQVLVPPTASERKGFQPVVALKVNRGVRANVSRGQTFTLTGTIELPPGTGKIISAQWNLDGSGIFPVEARLGTWHGNGVRVSLAHQYEKPGTHFPLLMATSQREGATDRGISLSPCDS